MPGLKGSFLLYCYFSHIIWFAKDIQIIPANQLYIAKNVYTCEMFFN